MDADIPMSASHNSWNVGVRPNSVESSLNLLSAKRWELTGKHLIRALLASKLTDWVLRGPGGKRAPILEAKVAISPIMEEKVSDFLPLNASSFLLLASMGSDSVVRIAPNFAELKVASM